MQTISGTLRASGASNVVASYSFDVLERTTKSQPGSLLFSGTSDENGEFSFQLRPGSFFLRVGSDLIPFRVKSVDGSTLFGQLVE